MLGRSALVGFFLQCSHKEVGVSKAEGHRQSQNDLTKWWDQLQPSSPHPVPMGSMCEEAGYCGSTHQQLPCGPSHTRDPTMGSCPLPRVQSTGHAWKLLSHGQGHCGWDIGCVQARSLGRQRAPAMGMGFLSALPQCFRAAQVAGKERKLTVPRSLLGLSVLNITTLGPVCSKLGFQVPGMILPREASWVSSLGTLLLNRVLP